MESFIEAVTPDTREQLNEVLDALRADREKSRTMRPDGSYVREKDGAGTDSQERLYRYFSTRRVTLPVSESGGRGGRAAVRSERVDARPAEGSTFWQRLKRAFVGD